MRVLISKPKGGTVTITVDDRRGITGLRSKAKGVAVADVPATTAVMVGKWSEKRKAMYDAKKAVSP